MFDMPASLKHLDQSETCGTIGKARECGQGRFREENQQAIRYPIRKAAGNTPGQCLHSPLWWNFGHDNNGSMIIQCCWGFKYYKHF